MTLVLPFPPSINSMYATVGNRRLLSKKGRQYKKEVGEFIMVSGYAQRYNLPLKGRLMVDIFYFAPSRRRYDISNMDKALLDAFSGIVYEDDSQIDELRARRGEVIGKPGKVIVKITEL